MLDNNIPELTREINKLNKILIGNGTPEQGVVVRLIRIEDTMHAVMENCKEVQQKCPLNQKPGDLRASGDSKKLSRNPVLEETLVWLIRIMIFIIFGKELFNSITGG